MIETHPIEPIYNNESQILILGSFPSVKSREGMFFYHHPKNRFWEVISSILNCPPPQTIEDKKNMLISNHIALWDVIKSCEIDNSSDSSIKNVEVNDFSQIIASSKIKAVFTNGAKSYELYKRYCNEKYAVKVIKLPSTSPANAKLSVSDLIEEWSVIKDYLFS